MSDRLAVVHEGEAGTSGGLLIRKIPAIAPWSVNKRPSVDELIKFGSPQLGLSRQVNEWREENEPRLRTRDFTLVDAYGALSEGLDHAKSLKPLDKLAIAEQIGLATLHGSLYLRVFRANGAVEPFGLGSLRVVTTVGVGYIVDAFQNLTELENQKFHGIGTGGTAEAVGDTALVTELTTQYLVNSTRATGTTTEFAANIYETVATNEVDAAVAITEHGIFSQAAVPGGVLLDRSVFSAVNLASGDRLETTYRFTVTAGS